MILNNPCPTMGARNAYGQVRDADAEDAGDAARRAGEDGGEQPCGMHLPRLPDVHLLCEECRRTPLLLYREEFHVHFRREELSMSHLPGT